MVNHVDAEGAAPNTLERVVCIPRKITADTGQKQNHSCDGSVHQPH
jgi:hypothetical protein